MFLGVSGSGSVIICTDQIFPSSSKKGKKLVISAVLWLFTFFLSLKIDENVPSKKKKRKKPLEKKLFFVDIWKATDEKSRILIWSRILICSQSWIRIQIRDSVVPIRIRTKILCIRYCRPVTACFLLILIFQLTFNMQPLSDDGSGEYSNSDEISSNSSTSVTSGMSKRLVQLRCSLINAIPAQRLPVTCKKGRSNLCLLSPEVCQG